jgi:MFS family permease
MEAAQAQETKSSMNHQAKATVVIFFIFMLLHQTDKLLIGPLQIYIMDTFKMTYTQWGLINTGALIVGSALYPVWGWLNDKYNRGKLLALASFIWGSTTWISAIAPTFKFFLVTRSSTGIDDSSYPGMYSLISDLFPPKMRGKIYGAAAANPTDRLSDGYGAGAGPSRDHWLALRLLHHRLAG